MLPLILSFLGSTAAGAGLLGSGLLASPLLMGAIGSGLGTAVQTGDLGKGLQAGLLGGIGGAVMGNLMGGASGSAMGAAQGAPAAGAAAANTGQTLTQAAQATQGATQGIGGMMNKMLPGGSGMGTIPPAPGITGSTFGQRFGQMGSGAGQTPFMDVAKYGFRNGAMTGAGMGAAMAPGILAPQLYAPKSTARAKREYPQADPAERQQYTPGADYRPGYSGEQTYFDPYPTQSRYAGGGLIRMAAGGLADMPQGNAVFPGAQAPQAPQMNDREIVSLTIKAIRNELPEQEAAMVLAQFVQTYGEDALRKVVSDVQEGRVPEGDMEGQIKGPGDGMDDLVPAAMDDGSSDVLLSDGEFIVPADVVSGLGNGSTDAGAAELDGMMDRVRQDRTGMRAQPKQVAAGGLLPA